MTSPPAPLGGQPSADAEPGPGLAVAAPPHSPRVRRSVITALVVLAMFAGLTLLVWAHGKPLGVDARLHGWALAHRSATSTALARDVTRGGSSIVVLPMVLAGGLLAASGGPLRRVGSAVLLGAVCVLGLLARAGVAHLVGRDRPPRIDWAAAAGGFAFPSGHTTAATLAAGLLAWAVARHLPPGGSRLPVWAAAFLFALAVGWSRVWLGVHWPTDVLGGWLFAGMCLAVSRVAQLRLFPAAVRSSARRSLT